MNRLALTLCLAIALPAAPALAASPFADKNLDEAVRKSLIDVKGDLTDEQLKNLYFLEAPGKGIKDLKGLEKCINLASVVLDNNQITDLTPLKGLTNIQSLRLVNNQISDIGPLAGLTKLQHLELTGNKVASLEPLKGLTALSSLYAERNQIADLTPLANLTKLSSLLLEKNKVKDIKPLAKLEGLMNLNLNDNEVADLSPLRPQQPMILQLCRNKITDLQPLVAAAQADAKGPMRFAAFLRLYVAGNPLSEAARTKQLADLKALGVRVESQ